MSLEIGAVIEGKITSITNFGAFVGLPDGKTGMIHISEISCSYVKEIKDHLKENDMVKAKVINIDKDGRVSLSIKKLEEENTKPQSRPVSRGRPDGFEWSAKKAPPAQNFEDMLTKFKSESDEKISALKRNVEAKRGSSTRRGGKY